MTDGPDVKLVEQNLRDLGYRGFGTPNEEYTTATETAIKKWQKKLGVDQTGVIELGDVVVAPAPVRVSSVTVALGAEANGEVLKYTGTTRWVTVDLQEDQQDIAPVGTKVTLTIDGQAGAGDGDVGAPWRSPIPTTRTPVRRSRRRCPSTTWRRSAPSTRGRWTSWSRRRSGRACSPCRSARCWHWPRAGTRWRRPSGKLVAVTTGLFADGMVEVSGEGLTEGMKVVTTS